MVAVESFSGWYVPGGHVSHAPLVALVPGIRYCPWGQLVSVQSEQVIATELLFGWYPDVHGSHIPSVALVPGIRYSPWGQLVTVQSEQNVATELLFGWYPDVHA